MQKSDYSTRVILGAINSRKRKQIEIESRSTRRNIEKFSRIAFQKLGKTESQIHEASPYNIHSSLNMLKVLVKKDNQINNPKPVQKMKPKFK
jgi:hypothetical protein